MQPHRVTDDTLRNLTYRDIYDHSVTVKDGLFEGEPFVSGGAARPRLELAEEPRVTGVNGRLQRTALRAPAEPER